MAKDYVPRGNGEFNSFQKNLAKMVVDKGAGWGIGNTAINKFKTASDKHALAYKAIANPASRTQGQVIAHTASRTVFEPTLRQFVNEYLASNSNVSVKEKKDMKLNLRLRKRHSRPPIDTRPALFLEVLQGARLMVLCREESSEGKCHIPKEVDAVEFAYSVGVQPQGFEDAQKTIISKSARFIIAFNYSDVGKKVFGFARWCHLNKAGKRGPHNTLPVMATII